MLDTDKLTPEAQETKEKNVERLEEEIAQLTTTLAEIIKLVKKVTASEDDK